MHRDDSLPSSFYLCYHNTREATNLYSFILHLQSHSKSMQLSETPVTKSFLLNSALSFVLFNDFKNFQSRKNVFIHDLFSSDMALIFSKTSIYIF